MIKIAVFICLIFFVFVVAGCEHYYHIYVINKSGNKQSISVLNYYKVNVDSLKFFPASENPTARNYKNASLYRKTIRQDSVYNFDLYNNETTLLQPIKIGSTVKAMIIKSDTVYFTYPNGFFNTSFKTKWTDRFIYVIH